ncbi:MAG TPA: 16S rRNA (cytidine(1402)-2'-O)-methyltransferase [Stellaceae bacterium]|nr:16S rRNA (cytidine(1402)-2'-O)-methyltransferase [Stellaceae bacterium]
MTSGISEGERQGEPSRGPDASKPSPAAADPSDRAGDGAAAPITVPPGLHLVATPIGNLADITLRALEILRRADLLLCEDTRVTGKLAARYGIATRRIAYNDHNAERMRPRILERLRGGATVALVSDAGTPLVSDPGYKLVRAAIAAGLPVSLAPGPAAPIAALALSGLPADRFLFAGFLPARAAARRQALAELAAVPATLILFESPHRLAASLADMAAVLGPRPAAVARELTKRHEEVRRADLASLAAHYAGAAAKGEIVVVVAPPERETAAARAAPGADLEARLRAALAAASLRDAAAAVAAETGLPRREVYRRALALLGDKR